MATQESRDSGTDMASAEWSAVAAPSSDLPAALVGTERPEAILQAIRDVEQAMTNHAEWLKNWHLDVLSHLNPGEPTPAEAGESEFASWYRGVRHRVLAEHPAFRDIGAKLRRMTAEAERIGTTVRETGTVPSGDYAEFMNIVLEFNAIVRKLENDTWNRLANIDPLTGIGNRQAMMAKLTIECERHERANQPCSVAMFDLDYFKAINDTHGHPAGDRVLRSIASLLAASIRPYDQVFRYGGEEFLMCLPNTDTRAAWAIVERLRLKVANWPVPLRAGQQIQVTVSVGVAPLAAHLGIDGSLDHADQALYRAKGNGRNCVYVWGPPAD